MAVVCTLYLARPPRELKFLKNVPSPPHATGHVSRVTFQTFFIYFFYKVVGLSGGETVINGPNPSSLFSFGCDWNLYTFSPGQEAMKEGKHPHSQ